MCQKLQYSLWLINEVCVPNKTENLNLSVFNKITEINELKTLKKHILYESKCKFDGRKCNSKQNWNNNKGWCEYKNPTKTLCVGKRLSLESCNMKLWQSKYLASITEDSVITCDEIIEKTKTVPKYCSNKF